MRPSPRVLAYLGVLAVFCGMLLPSARCEEPAQAFLTALRERGYDELVLDYLDRAAVDPHVAADFKSRIDLERGKTLLKLARSSDSLSQAEARLHSARETLANFATAHKGSDEAVESQLEVGDVLFDLGRRELATALELEKSQAAKREKRLTAARGMLAESRELFTAGANHYDAARKKFGEKINQQDNPRQYATRHEYRTRLLRCRLRCPRIDVLVAESFPAEAPQRKKLAAAAAKTLAELYEKYEGRSFVEPYQAHFYQGQAHILTGETDKALACFELLMLLPTEQPWSRSLVTKSMWKYAELQLAAKEWDKVIEMCAGWLDQARGREQTDPDWMLLRYCVGIALVESVAQVSPGNTQYKTRRRAARQLFRAVANKPGLYRQQAQVRYAQLSRGAAADESDDIGAMKSFEDAFQQGKDAYDLMRTNRSAVDAARQNAPDSVAELEAGAAENQVRAEALLARSLELATDQTSTDDLNWARYYLCRLNFLKGNYWYSAVLGEFLARQYPDSAVARSAANHALASFERLYHEARDAGAPPESLAAETSHIIGIAQYVTKRWSGTDDARRAYRRLVEFSVRENRWQHALEMLEELPPSDRVPGQLRIGQAAWRQFVSDRQSKQRSAAELDTLKERARELLTAGVDLALSGPAIDQVVAHATLSLIQLQLDDNNYAAAIKLLDHQAGPLALIKSGDSAAADSRFQSATYQAALRTYLSLDPPRLDDAFALMDEMEERLSDADTTALVSIYLSLGSQLQTALQRLQKQGAEEQVKQLSDAFAKILDRLASSGDSAKLTTLQWVGVTYMQLAERAPAPDAGRYYEAALNVLRELDRRAQENAELAADERRLLAIRKLIGDCLRKQGKYAEAMNVLEKILRKQPMLLDVQTLAAYTYQDWGSENANRYRNAISGGRRPKSGGDNRIWGWVKISRFAARLARKDQKYRDLYFESRLNIIKSRYLSAMESKGADRTKQLQTARASLAQLHQLNPALGGEVWSTKFEKLARNIQQGLGEKVTGLKGLK